MNTLNRLKEICAAATPGPWFVSIGHIIIDTRHQIDCGNGNVEVDGEEYALFLPAESTDADARLTATARQALPALIDLVEALDKKAVLVERAKEYDWHADMGYTNASKRFVDEFDNDLSAAISAVDEARKRLEEVCPK